MTTRSRVQGFWRFLRTLQWCALGSVGVLLLTWVAFRLHFSFLTASFCYLILLVAQSLAGDFASAAVVSVAAVACLDYFFVAPLALPPSLRVLAAISYFSATHW